MTETQEKLILPVQLDHYVRNMLDTTVALIRRKPFYDKLVDYRNLIEKELRRFETEELKEKNRRKHHV